MHLSILCVHTPSIPSLAAWGNTKGFDIALIKDLCLGIEFLIKPPYF